MNGAYIAIKRTANGEFEEINKQVNSMSYHLA